MMARKQCKVTSMTSMSSRRKNKMMTIIAVTWRTILQRTKCLVINCHFGWQRPSFTTSQSAAQPPLQQIYCETSTEYRDRVKLAARGDPVQTITTLKRMAMKKNLRTECEVMEFYVMIVYVMMEVEK